MTHDEILDLVQKTYDVDRIYELYKALRVVVELHSGEGISNRCVTCSHGNKCETIQAIEKELQ